MVSLRQLRYFQAVARLGHFGQAADACAVSQPALSMQVQELERELGVTLLERRPRGVRLTPAGEEVARRAARVLAEVQDLADYARHSRAPLGGTLRLGVIPTIAPYLLPPLLPRVREGYPDLNLAIWETRTARLLDRLRDGDLDLLLLALPVDTGSDIETVTLFDDPFLLAVPFDQPAGSSARATAEMLNDDRLLLLEEGHCLRDHALAYCELRQVPGVDTFGASSLSTLVEMVANGMGLTLLPEMSLPVEARGDRVRLVPFEPPVPQRSIGLAWRTTSPRKPEFTLLGAMIATMSGEMKASRGAMSVAAA